MIVNHTIDARPAVDLGARESQPYGAGGDLQNATDSLLSRPAWADRNRDMIDRDSHPDDWGVRLQSVALDEWTPADNDEPISVHVWGFRHDSAAVADWPDEILVSGDVNPGCAEGVCLQVADARRLAMAMLAACDLADGSASVASVVVGR